MNMASDTEQNTRLCGNCKRDIPEFNFTIHEIHCKRNISVCKLCKEPFPTSEMEEHMETEHTPVICKCKMTVEKCDLEEHKLSACPLRLVKCQFCELELAFNKLGDHVEYCGARTESCETCGRSVMKKDLEEHPQVCGKETAPKKPARAYSVENRDLAIDGAWFEFGQNNSRDNMLSRTQSYVPGRFYNRSSAVESMRTRFNGLGEQNSLSLPVRNRSKNIPKRQPEEKVAAPSVPNRELSGFHSSRSLSLQNNRGSSPEPESTGNYEFWASTYLNNRETLKTPRWAETAKNESPDFSALPDTLHTDEIKLPCEFCDKLIPENDLILHQSGCNSSAFAPFFNGRSSPKPQRDDQLQSKVDWLSKPSVQSVHPASSTPPPFNDLQSILIPCEFCGVVLEQDILFHHQIQCDMAATSEPVSSFQTLLPSSNNSNMEESGFEKELPSFLSHQDAIYSYKNNLKAENSSKPFSSIKPSHPDQIQPYQTTASKPRFSVQQSNVDDATINEGDNTRIRSRLRDYPRSVGQKTSYFSDYTASSRGQLSDARNKPKAKTNSSAVNGDIEKEE